MSVELNFICQRCSQVISIDHKNTLCQRCLDVLEFGYPSFHSYPHGEAEKNKQVQRMELSEGWVLPDFIFNK